MVYFFVTTSHFGKIHAFKTRSFFLQIIYGRMLGVNEEGLPIVHLYGWVSVDDSVSQHEQQPRLLNRELVDRSVALWTEHFIAANGGASAPATTNAAAAAVAN